LESHRQPEQAMTFKQAETLICILLKKKQAKIVKTIGGQS
jgi:hypothetical protein